MAIDGSSVLLLAQTAEGPPGTYLAVGSQTGVKFDRKTATIDISDKSSPEKRYLAGERDETISLDHLYVANDTAFAALKNAWKTNQPIVVERSESGVPTEHASAYITQMTEDFKRASAGTVAMTLQVTGGWSAGSAP